MATGFGIAVTNLTSKFGILSRKACIRLATETGEKVLAHKSELGRNLNTEELEQVFAEVLPKRCRPKIITTETKVRECMQRDGYNEKQIDTQIAGCKKNYMAAATIFNGTKKLPIYMPAEGESWIPEALKPYLDLMVPASVAHETEHALENNCRIFDIFKRKVSGIKKFFGKLFDKNYMEKLNNREVAVHKFEGELHKSLSPIVNAGEVKINCEPTVESISEKLGGEGKLVENLRNIMRENYASGVNKGSEQDKRFKLMSFWMDMERPAYEVTGKMEEKIFGLTEGEHAVNTGIAKAYETAISVAKQERRTYWKNKLLGRLKKPNIYLSDKDILRHASNKEEKEILTKMIANMEKEEKISLIRFLSANQGQKSPVKSLHQFLEATKIDGKPLYTNLEYLEGISPEMLTNPDFIKIAKLSDASFSGTPAYKWALKNIAKCTPEQIRDFAKIADTKEVVVPQKVELSAERSAQLKKFLGISENTAKTSEINAPIERPIEYSYRYNLLASYISNPHFNELKAFADIKVGNNYPYADLVGGITRLPKERIKENLELAQIAAKDGKSVFKEICKEIDEFSAKA